MLVKRNNMQPEDIGTYYESILEKEVRKEGGIYYTPPLIVDYMIANSLGELLKDKTPAESAKIKIVDPACGGGIFLLGAYQYLLDWHEKHFGKLTLTQRRKILNDHIFGVDIDPLAVEITKYCLSMKCLGGKEFSLDFAENIRCGNSLISHSKVSGDRAFDWHKTFPHVFDTGGFDIVIGNPPYVESRSTNVSAKLKTVYQEQVNSDFGGFSQYITKGSDLLVYFFPRSITLLSEKGIGMLIVQNGWLNTDYGAKVSQFLVKTLQHVKIVDSPFRHFNRASANVNTVIVRFKKQSDVKKIEFDSMKKEGEKIVTQKGKSFDMGDRILSDMKWGMVMSTDTDILSVLTSIIEKGKNIDQSFYTVGQGINVSQNSFIPKKEKSKFQQKTNIINAVFKEYQYSYTRFAYFLYHSFKPNPSDISILESINAEEFGNGHRKYPSIIMPRGIGAIHFAGLLNGKALLNSFVDVYMDTYNEEKKLNIWLFCNSSLFFLYRELSGRKNLGGGLLKSEAADIKLFPLYFPIADKDTILSVMHEMGEPINLQDRLETPIQKKIDKLVFAYFRIKSDGQTKVINDLLRQFHFRYNKAKN